MSMRPRDHIILAFTIFIAVGAAMVGSVEYYRWKVESTLESAAEKARQDAEIDRKYEAMMRERESNR